MRPKHYGIRGRRWRTIRASVLAASDICVWCGHVGARAVNHNYPRSRFPELAMVRGNMTSVHGVEGCPVCPRRTGKPRNCNSEIGDRILFVEVFPPGPPRPVVGTREW